MTLREKQSTFVRMIAKLIDYATTCGYELTFGDAYRDKRCPYGSVRSKHSERLAVDFNLFIDGEYKTATEDHSPLGKYWESIGGTWGGRFKDGNHYEYGGE